MGDILEADPLAGGWVAGRVVVRDHEGAGDVVGARPVDRGDLEAARVDDLAGGPVGRWMLAGWTTRASK